MLYIVIIVHFQTLLKIRIYFRLVTPLLVDMEATTMRESEPVLLLVVVVYK